MLKKIFNLFKRKETFEGKNHIEFDINKTVLILAYEVARSDGSVDQAELDHLKSLIDESESKDSIINQLKEFSSKSSSFYDLIREINQSCTKEQKEGIIRILWDVAYSDDYLKVHEEKIIRRIADLIMIKDIRTLKIKDDSKNASANNL